MAICQNRKPGCKSVAAKGARTFLSARRTSAWLLLIAAMGLTLPPRAIAAEPQPLPEARDVAAPSSDGARDVPARSPLFPPGSSVVLVAGLAGDVETEAAYRQQLQEWIEIASRSQPAFIAALCDSPAAIRLAPEAPAADRGTSQPAARAPVKALKNDRQTFLELAQTLPRNSNALVVIAWGHGGKLRDAPVLHVRGPRLTPTDFSDLAVKVNAQTSHWLFLFRGSGAFAKQLAGPAARVLSSEAEQSFNSDPISMPILLRLANSPAANSFENLAREFGRATAGWYTERSLARTEDPAWWTAEGKPELLARVGSPPLHHSTTPSLQAPSPASLQHSTTPSLQFPNKVDPADFPDADAVMLKQRLSCTLGSNPALRTEKEAFIQVFTPEAKELGDFDVEFAPPHEEVQFLDCEVLRPDGKLVRLDPDRIDESREQPLGDYQGPRRKFFSLPGIVPGAIIHIRYRTEWKKFPLPQISLELPIGDELPVMSSSVEITHARDTPFHYAFEELSAASPATNHTAYGTTYSWRFTNLPPFAREILSPPRQHPRLLFSTFADWHAFAGWYSRISRLTAEVTPEIAAKAKEITASLKTDREKLEALYNYVAGMRYVAVPLGINSVRPHAAANVLENQFGDCKDKANLLNALLHSLNMEAHLVLVPRFSQAHDAVPGLAFNHAISRVKLGSETLWLDTTEDICRFGLLPPGDYGRKVLVIDDQTKELTQLPAADPKQHRLEINGRINLAGPNQPQLTALKTRAHGYPDYEFRAIARELKSNRSGLPFLAAKYRPAAGTFALQRQKASSVSALEEDFTWSAEGSSVGVVSGTDKAPLIRAAFWIPKEWDLALHQRRTPLFLNQGYPLTLEQSFEIQLPAGARAVSLPAACQNGEGPLRWQVKWTTMGRDRVGAQLRTELERGELSVEQTASFQRQVRELLAALGAQIALETSTKE